MQVSVEQLEGLERRLVVQVPAKTIDQEVLQRLQTLSRQVRLDGFRPGKAPLKVVRRMYGAKVRQDVLNESLQTSFKEALEQQQLVPASIPDVRIQPVSADAGADFEYHVTFEVWPEFEPVGIAGETIQRPIAEITEADVDNMVETLRKQRVNWNPVERAAQSGDRVTLSFTGTIEGESFPGHSADHADIVLGQNDMLQDFEAGLLGRQAGDNAEFDVTFPDNHLIEQLAGKTAHFSVQLHHVSEPVLPEVDADFATALGIANGDLEQMRQELRTNMQRELQNVIQVNIKSQVIDKLVAANVIEVPRAAVAEQMDSLIRQMGLIKEDEPVNEELRAVYAQRFEPQARRRALIGAVILRFAESRNVTIDSARVQQRLEEIAASYEDSAAFINHYRNNQDFMNKVSTLAFEDQIVDMLLAEATIEDKPMSFDQLMRPQPAAATTEEASL